MQIFDTKIFLLYTFLCDLEYHNSDQFQFLFCARCKKLLVYVYDYHSHSEVYANI